MTDSLETSPRPETFMDAIEGDFVGALAPFLNTEGNNLKHANHNLRAYVHNFVRIVVGLVEGGLPDAEQKIEKAERTLAEDLVGSQTLAGDMQAIRDVCKGFAERVTRFKKEECEG